MNAVESALIRRSLNDVLAEDGEFARGVHTLAGLIGREYQPYNVTAFGLNPVSIAEMSKEPSIFSVSPPPLAKRTKGSCSRRKLKYWFKESPDRYWMWTTVKKSQRGTVVRVQAILSPDIKRCILVVADNGAEAFVEPFELVEVKKS